MHKQQFPLISSAWATFLESTLVRYVEKKGTLLSIVPSIPLFEGSKFGIIKDETSEAKELKEASAKLAIEHSVLRDTDLFHFRRILVNFADDMVASIERGAFSSLGQQLSDAGQTVKSAGQPFSWETFLEGLEKIDLQFDVLGNWLPPTMVLSPKLYPHVQRVLTEAQHDPEKIQQFRELIKRKKAEFERVYNIVCKWNDAIVAEFL